MYYNQRINHRNTIRVIGFDYSKEGFYFITICCDKRKLLFGNIENGKMILNAAGKKANDCWLEIPEHFPNAILHEHIVMPNHIHGIIELAGFDNFIGTENHFEVGGCIRVEDFQPLRHHPNIPTPTLYKPNHPPRNEFQKIIPRSIGSIIKGYKIGVTKWFRNVVGVENFQPGNFQPAQITKPRRTSHSRIVVWQRNYYEHIIRDSKSYGRISNYIINNPANWGKDRLNK